MRPYAWGSRTVLPELLGEKSPADEPWAEIWMGAHPGDPSRVPDGRSLAEVEPELPYMVKLLAAEEPLSIQAHPDREQARRGFAAEEAAGIALGAPERSYRDENHKPELLVAMTPVTALCGFREPAEVLRLASRLGVPRLDALLAPLRAGPSALGEVFEALARYEDHGALVAEVAAACTAYLVPPPALRADHDAVDARVVFRWTAHLAERFPGDPGVVAPLLLRLVTLAPGQGVFVDSGVLHAYLHGAGVEIQASSDNVLRGALTPKHVNVPELMKVVRFEVCADPVVHPRRIAAGVDTYDVPASDFVLWRVRPSDVGPATVPAVGPRIVVCVEGSVEVAGVRLEPGRAAFVPAEVSPLVVHGDGACFVTATSR
jgi:mannose-6-phosphate isomerase